MVFVRWVERSVSGGFSASNPTYLLRLRIPYNIGAKAQLQTFLFYFSFIPVLSSLLLIGAINS